MNAPPAPSTYALVLLRTIEVRPTTYSLEEAARLSGLHPEMLRYYCHIGVFGEAFTLQDQDPRFDDNALFEVRRFEQFRLHHRLDRKTVRLICDLQRQVERLQSEVRFLRGA